MAVPERCKQCKWFADCRDDEFSWPKTDADCTNFMDEEFFKAVQKAVAQRPNTHLIDLGPTT